MIVLIAAVIGPVVLAVVLIGIGAPPFGALGLMMLLWALLLVLHRPRYQPPTDRRVDLVLALTEYMREHGPYPAGEAMVQALHGEIATRSR